MCCFALWYWFIEMGNTRLLQAAPGPAWDFLFPQRQADYPGYMVTIVGLVGLIGLVFTARLLGRRASPSETHVARALTWRWR